MTYLDKRELGCELEPSLRPRVKMGLAVLNPDVQVEPEMLPEQLGEDKFKLGLEPMMDLDKQELGCELEPSLRPRVKMGLAKPNLDVQAEREMLPEEVRAQPQLQAQHKLNNVMSGSWVPRKVRKEKVRISTTAKFKFSCRNQHKIDAFLTRQPRKKTSPI